MNRKNYWKDRCLYLICVFLFYFLFLGFSFLFQVNMYVVFFLSFFYMVLFGICFLVEYQKRKSFYQDLFFKLGSLDQKYLIQELLEKPSFLEGELLRQILYECNKSMKEHINEIECMSESFKEYIELWIHDVKIPLSSSLLMLHNNKADFSQKMKLELLSIESYVEQVLFYVRSQMPEKDYHIKQVLLKDVVKEAILKQKEAFLGYHIRLELKDLDILVATDSKWLMFMVSQILSNSIKYRQEEAMIVIQGISEETCVKLQIIDNGIGIQESDLGRVFEKSFTGANGNNNSTSTGMGLFICKNLCDKLGHFIHIESENGVTVTISFFKHTFYSDVL